MLKIIAGALILMIVIGIYVFISYMRDKKIGDGKGGCNGNCASCNIHTKKCDR